MAFTILHLSDLHRDLTDETPNDWLVHSIREDLARLANDGVPMPSIALVTGDMIYGTSPDRANWQQELDRQYEQALEFLISLCDAFFGGLRDRVVILPGNHDVSYPTMMESGTFHPMPNDHEERSAIVAQLWRPHSSIRWSWTKFQYFSITDRDKYNGRFSGFSDLYDRFYRGARTYSLDPRQQFDVFDFPTEKLSVLTLNSCYNNDPLRRAGAIEPMALAAMGRMARSPDRAGWTIATAWHHNLSGGPLRDDYLDEGFLQLLLESGVSLGFHGHQHRATCIEERYKVGPAPRRMAVVSAATLCAGPAALTPGIPRGFNLVQLDTDTHRGRVYQRQMVNDAFATPVWGPGHYVANNADYVDFEFSAPTSVRPAGLDEQRALESASELLGRRQWEDAIATLQKLPRSGIVRSLILEAIRGLNNPTRTVEVITAPENAAELVTLGSAIIEIGSRELLDGYLKMDAVIQSGDASVAEITGRVRRRLDQ